MKIIMKKKKERNLEKWYIKLAHFCTYKIFINLQIFTNLWVLYTFRVSNRKISNQREYSSLYERRRERKHWSPASSIA